MTAYEKRLNVSLTLDQWKQLRKMSYEDNISMNELIRNAIDIFLKKEKDEK